IVWCGRHPIALVSGNENLQLFTVILESAGGQTLAWFPVFVLETIDLRGSRSAVRLPSGGLRARA
ncbi:hypothetical protein, partial [Pelomonas sp. KK5]|uniref:hypothetical protein n=1 Tax=Pelomonas sp. KK5 TaxID=1855730 RepID=UPI001E36EE08